VKDTPSLVIGSLEAQVQELTAPPSDNTRFKIPHFKQDTSTATLDEEVPLETKDLDFNDGFTLESLYGISIRGGI